MSRYRGRRRVVVKKYFSRGRRFYQKWTNKKVWGLKLKWWALILVGGIGVLGLAIVGIAKALDIKPRAAVKLGIDKVKGK